MSFQLLDGFDTAAPWSAHAPDAGASGSLQLSAPAVRLGDGWTTATRLQMQCAAGATGHYAERSIPVVDLSSTTELRLRLRCGLLADGTTGAPFFLRIRLASEAVKFADAANTWERLLPVSQANYWQLVRLSLSDLPAAVRSAVTRVRLEATTAAAFIAVFDSLLVGTERVLADVEAALIGALDKQVASGGATVPALIYLPAGPLPAVPNIRICPAMVEYAPDLSVPVEVRGDYTSTGFAMQAGSRGFNLYYDIDADGAQPGDRAALLDFVLDKMLGTSLLPVNGEYLPVDMVPVPFPTATPPVRLPLRLRIRAWKPTAVPVQAVRPVKQIDLHSEGVPQ